MSANSKFPPDPRKGPDPLDRFSSPGDQTNYYQLLYEQERLNRELLEQEQKKKQQQIKHLQQLISTVLALVVLAACVIGYFTVHVWTDPVCGTYQTCRLCGRESSTVTVHNRLAATCSAPETCSICGETWGNQLEHLLITDPNSGTAVCALCGKTEELLIQEDPEQFALQIALSRAKTLADGRNYRDAIRILDEGWIQFGDPAYLTAAAQYRQEFGIYNSSFLAAGKFNTLLVDKYGSVRICGDQTYKEQQANNWTDIVAVSAGDRHVVGLKSDGTVVTAGANDANQITIPGWGNVIAISAGDTHTAVLLADGTVAASKGYNYWGECNVENLMYQAGDRRIVAIASGYTHTLALLEDGRVVACGDPETGVCNVDHWTDIVAIYAGTRYSAGLRSNGTVVVTGSNSWDVSQWTDIVNLSAGDYFLAGLRADGTVVTVGMNGDTARAHSQYSLWTDIVFIAAGHNHLIGVRSDGQILCDGYKNKGQCDFEGEYIDLN